MIDDILAVDMMAQNAEFDAQANAEQAPDAEDVGEPEPHNMW